MRILIAMCLAFLFSGCVKVPPQMAVLSAHHDSQLAQDKRNDEDLLDEYFSLARDAAYEQMKYYWIPRIIKDMLSGTNDDGKTFDEAVCDEKGQMDRALEIQNFVEHLNGVIREQERELILPIRAEEREARAGFRVQHNLMEKTSGAVTSGLQSILKEQELRDKVLKKLNLPTDAMTPIRRATERFKKKIGKED